MVAILERLDPPSDRRVALRVTNDALRQLRSGHPWLFDRSITSGKTAGKAGDLAVVFDGERRFAAIGLYDPRSPIRVRILHVGRPTLIDGDWLADRLADAVDRRRSLFGTSGGIDEADGGPVEHDQAHPTTAYRLVHGENDGLPGLVVDWYSGSAVVKLYTAAWIPWLPSVVAGLSVATQRSDLREAPGVLERVVLRLGRSIAGSGPPGIADGVVLAGPTLDGPVEFFENGLPFTADLAHGHKTGHFLDQRDNRSLVGRLVGDAVGSGGGHRVLDVFSCTGGFAAHAAAAGADDLTFVDVSERALELARHHVDGAVDSRPRRSGPINGRPEVATVAGDAFDVMAHMAQAGRQFDTVVVDPPSFANRADQVDRALAAYHRSARLAARLVAPHGLLFHASCSARVTEASFLNQIQRGIADANREASVLTVTGHPVDHPIGFVHGAYLKAVALRLTP